MNIAIFASAFHPSLGGVEELCRQLALELKSRGHHVIIVTNRWPRDLPAYEVFQDLPLYRLPFRLPEPLWKARISYWLTTAWVKRQLAGILRREGIDVLHVQCVSSNAHYALEARRSLGLPLVVTLQGELTMDATQLFQRSQLARDILKRGLLEAEQVTACSRKTLRDAEEFIGVQTLERGKVVFNAARIEDFVAAAAHPHPRPYIFALGRLVPQKGFDVLLAALARSHCSHDLILAGEGPEAENLQTRAKALGIGHRVSLVGRADRPAVAGYMKGAEFFVLPSTADEGLPVVCAEAMAAGKAIVATDSGGTAEAVLPGKCGLIIPKGDEAALTRAFDTMASDEGFRQGAGAASGERARHFHWNVITSHYEAVYRRALEARGTNFGPVLKTAVQVG